MYYSENALLEVVTSLKNNFIKPDDYINLICKRIDKAEPFVKALLPEKNRKERLLEEIQMIFRKYPDISQRPPLFGIPVGVKDIYRVNSFETKAGSLLPSSLFQGPESSVISMLKKNGAIILGKTVTTEFAYAEPGPTCNPHNIKHTPGGSSSGSAAAVACGYCPLALGTQTIGSVIRPASYCGIFGYKPSKGRISTDGVIPFSKSADHIGFFTRDIEGIILCASLLCSNWKTPISEETKKPVIAVPVGSYLEQAEKEVRIFFESKLEYFEKQGYTILRIDVFEDINKINEAHFKMIAADFYQVHKEWINKYAYLYKHKTLQLISEGKNISYDDFTRARAGRELLRNKIEKISNENNISLWLSPATTTAAPAGLDSTGSPLMNLPWTHAGLPVLSVPGGKNSNGLPLGLQFSGLFCKDEIMLSIIADSIIPSF